MSLHNFQCIVLSLIFYFFSQSSQVEEKETKVDNLLCILPILSKPIEKAETLNTIPKLHQNISTEKSSTFNKRLFDSASNIKSTKGVGYYHLNNIYLFQAKGFYKESIVEAINAESILSKIENQYLFLDTVYFQAISLFFSDQLNESPPLKLKETTAEKNKAYHQQMGQLDYNIGNHKKGDFVKTKLNLDQPIQLMNDEKNMIHGEVYKEIDFTDKELNNNKKAKETRVKGLQIDFDLKEKQIKNLTNQLQKKTIDLQEKEREQKQLILVIIFCFIIILLIIIFIYIIRDRNKKLIINNNVLKNASEEIQKLYQEQQILLKNIENSNQTIKKTFSIISHDLRAPFNLLLGYSNYINSNFEEMDREDIKSYLSIIHKAANNNYNFTQQLLSWSLKQQNGITISKKLHNLNDTVDKSIATQIEIANQKHIIIEKEYMPTDLTNLIFDADIVFNITYNIINNAIKYSNNHSIIIVKTALINENMQIEVSDEGIGIEEQLLIKLNAEMTLNDFKFKVTDNEYKGGFGLSYVKELVALHGGKLVYSSIVGKGTKVVINIPLEN
jgi:signal transduction histidine kinase